MVTLTPYKVDWRETPPDMLVVIDANDIFRTLTQPAAKRPGSYYTKPCSKGATRSLNRSSVIPVGLESLHRRFNQIVVEINKGEGQTKKKNPYTQSYSASITYIRKQQT